MMYEALLFDMNALGDIPDKDFTSKATRPGSSPVEGRDRGRSPNPHQVWRREPATSREAETGPLLFSDFWVLNPTSHTLASRRV